MNAPDLEDRVTAADPQADEDLSAGLARVRDRVLAELARPPARTWRPRWRLLAVATAAAAAVVAVMAFLPGSRDERTSPLGAAFPGPVRAFAAEMTGEGILHVIREQSAVINGRGEVRPMPRPERLESWYALDGSRSRTRWGGEGGPMGESIRDGRVIEIVQSGRGLTQRLEIPEDLRGQEFGSWVLELRRALAAGRARIEGETTVRGRPVYDVALDLMPSDEHPVDLHAFVARDDHALLRIEQLRLPFPKDRDASHWDVARSEVLAFDVLPSTPESQRLLELSPELRDDAKIDARPRLEPHRPRGG